MRLATVEVEMPDYINERRNCVQRPTNKTTPLHPHLVAMNLFFLDVFLYMKLMTFRWWRTASQTARALLALLELQLYTCYGPAFIEDKCSGGGGTSKMAHTHSGGKSRIRELKKKLKH